MEVLHLEQGSDEWHQVRIAHRTASETPAVLGIPGAFNTANDVRKYKKGHRSEGNVATEHGNKYEEMARKFYCEIYEPITPAVCKDGDYLASLDGINEAGDVIVEIKCPYKGRASKLWIEVAGASIVPEHYWYQVQHQLMVTGAKMAYFFVVDTYSGDHIRLAVVPEPSSWEKIRKGWDEFWPTINDRDDPAWKKVAKDYIKAHKAVAEATKALDEAKEALKALAEGKDSAGCGVRVQRVERAGTVDWKAVQKQLLPDVDIEPYRKAGGVDYRVSMTKESGDV